MGNGGLFLWHFAHLIRDSATSFLSVKTRSFLINASTCDEWEESRLSIQKSAGLKTSYPVSGQPAPSCRDDDLSIEMYHYFS